MGYYIETPSPFDKASQLLSLEGARPSAFHEGLPGPDHVLVCVVDNGWMEAAGVVYDENELRAFSDPTDYRPKQWLTLPRATAIALNPKVARVLK